MKYPYEGQTSYTVNIEGREEVLPVAQVSPDIHIASFVLLGNVLCPKQCAKI